MATFPRLVNKQFNSPIGLYSQSNIQDTLNKQSQVLDNGAVGIDFSNPINSKPANLANSAVLRMLEEEEERQRNGQIGSLKRVAWPPPAEENGEEPHEAPVRQATPVKLQQSPALSRLIPIEREHGPPQAKVYSPQPPPTGPNFVSISPQTKPISPLPNFGARSPLSPKPTTPTQIFPPPIPDSLNPNFQRAQPSAFARPAPKTFAPVEPELPQYFAPPPVQQYAPVSPQSFGPVNPPGFGPAASPAAAPAASISPRGWAPVTSPTPLVASAQNQFVEPPPAVVALRPAAPVHLPPPPVVTSQPATNSFRGGVNMRGDQKWPPQSVKEAVAAENDARISLAKGPACRPRKVKKDYGQFFAQNALPHNYPGYRAPPGTQHFDDVTGNSQF